VRWAKSKTPQTDDPTTLQAEKKKSKISARQQGKLSSEKSGQHAAGEMEGKKKSNVSSPKRNRKGKKKNTKW